MKKITIDFPVVGWGSATIEVEDDYDVDNLRQDIEDGEVDVAWDGKIESPQPLLSLNEVHGDLGEIPYELTVNES